MSSKPKRTGPGTELKNIIQRWTRQKQKEKGGCRCNAHEVLMNEKGIRWCEKNIDEIVGWLRQEAKERKLPFNKKVAVWMIKLAIKRAKKKS